MEVSQDFFPPKNPPIHFRLKVRGFVAGTFMLGSWALGIWRTLEMQKTDNHQVILATEFSVELIVFFSFFFADILLFLGLKCCLSGWYMISDETWETSPIKERTTTTFRIEESTFCKPRAASSPRRASQRIEILRVFFKNEAWKMFGRWKLPGKIGMSQRAPIHDGHGQWKNFYSETWKLIGKY